MDKPPEFICINWRDRSLGNKIGRLIYKLFRVLFASIWFYYIPFISIFMSYAVPFAMRDYDGVCESSD